MSDDVLHLEIRKKIYKLLVVNPGLNLSTIAETLQISVALADYHLYYLEEKNLISIDKEGGYKRYYVKGSVGVEEKKILSLLQQELPLNIILVLLSAPRSKPKDIREKLGISPALLTYYLKKMIRYGIITEVPSEEKNQYVVAKEEDVVKLLISYKQNVLLERFKDTWTVDFPLSSKVASEKKKEAKDKQ
jgi:predicted transcriptional regulator